MDESFFETNQPRFSYQPYKLETVIKNGIETQIKDPEYNVTFSTKPENYCVGMVDIVSSTKIAASLSPIKYSRYYEIFLNSMSKILNHFEGKVIKNVGDCLLYYFPESSSKDSKSCLMSNLECALSMVELQKKICTKLTNEGLPCLNYRVSSDYGSVMMMKSNSSDVIDMIGPPVNMCNKINRCAKTNCFVIGSDLYEIVKSFPNYKFKQTNSCSVGFKYDYPVFTVLRKC